MGKKSEQSLPAPSAFGPMGPEGALILAAGGIVEKGAGTDTRIALVYRERRYRDWSLPKGKQDAGESLAETALREVYEEIGCRARLAGFAGCVQYFHKDIPKVVVYWKMALLDEEEFTPNKEVQDLAWLTPTEALARMSYDEEKNLLRRLYPAA